MRWTRWLLAWGAVGLVWCGSTAPARAGEHYWHCPHSSYSPLHYWAPGLYYKASYLHSTRPFLYGVDRHPEVPYGYIIQRFPCPETDPAALYPFPQLDHPPPPPTTQTEPTKPK